MRMEKRRDLNLIHLPEGTLVVSCDSCGGIGEKSGDALRAAAIMWAVLPPGWGCWR